MNDEKLKIVLAILSGIIFSLIFILLAFVLPLREGPETKSFDDQLKRLSQGIKEGSGTPPPSR